MAVAYVASSAVSATDWSRVTISTPTFTVSSGQSAIVAFTTSNAPTSLAITVGAQSAVAISGAVKTDSGYTYLYFCQTPTVGSGKAATATWTGTADVCCIACARVTGANGTNGGAAATSVYAKTIGLSLTSSANDLTFTCVTSISGSGDGAITSNQTRIISDVGCLDYGPGTSNPTHTWSHATNDNMALVGANIVAAAAAGTPLPVLMNLQRQFRN